MKKQAILSLALAAAMLCGCSAVPQTVTEVTAATDSTSAPTIPEEVFSSRDFETNYDEAGSAQIMLNGDNAQCESDAVQISGGTVTITDEGTYILSGTLTEGMIIVDSEKIDKTQLVLSGVNICSKSSAPIYIRKSDKVFITLAPDTENTLTNGGTFTAIDENNINAVIFSKEDLTINGSGSLIIESPAGHGIVSKDALRVTGGSYNITSANHAVSGKDEASIAAGAFTLTSGKDGIHAENADDPASGFVQIEGGSFSITAEGDGISASAGMNILGGSFAITTGGGSINAAKQTSDSWGGFMGGGRGPGGNRGGPMDGGKRNGGFGDPMAPSEPTESEDSTSIKGIRAAGNLTIQGGSFVIDSADDALHSNANLTVTGGSFQISSGDDGFHADETLALQSGSIRIKESYEGMEGLHILISGGDITLTASDDGLNAAGGTDQSGFGGTRGNDRFGAMGGASNGSIEISGGSISITASGDGIDANGSIAFSGGHTTVCGPTMGDTATLDYDTTAEINGGIFIGTGASGMAQTFSGGTQGVIAVSVGNQTEGTQITLFDASGNQILTCTPELSYGVVILSSPDVIKGESYTVSVGAASGELTAD